MKLGSYTFTALPDKMSAIEQDKESANIKTYSSVAYFSWGVSYVGKVLELIWDYMEATDYSSLRTIYEADDSVVFEPEISEEETTFNVEVLDCYGQYFYDLTTVRKQVTVRLLILSEVA